jgi:Arc/MetJ-type ribon-helix-helix transcriptional regulator
MTSEKISVNVSSEVLAKIDLLVEDGFYSNRSDFVNQALDEKLNGEKPTLDKLLDIHDIVADAFTDRPWCLGVITIDKRMLLKAKERGKKLRIGGFGVLYISRDITLDLVKETVEKITGSFKIYASKEIEQYLKNLK